MVGQSPRATGLARRDECSLRRIAFGQVIVQQDGLRIANPRYGRMRFCVTSAAAPGRARVRDIPSGNSARVAVAVRCR
jgi:hypothetical protein